MFRRFFTLFICLGAAVAARAAAMPAPGLEFIENRGQWVDAVRFAAPVPGGRLFVETDGLTYSLIEPFDFHHHEGRPAPPQRLLKGQAVQVRFVGAAAAALLPSQPSGEVRNYFIGQDEKRWASGVAGYRQLRYQRLWPGIDAHFYENDQQRLEYDFELAPQADAAAVRLHYAGADQLRLRADGALEISTAVGTITELAPRAWQLDSRGRRQPVSCHYVLQGTEVSFRLGRYDHRRPLTIDPTVVFSSVTGSTAENWGFTATYDQQGNLYSGGIAFNPGYPASPGAYRTSFSGVIDMAVIKYNTAANGAAARLWATYIGGTQADFAESMVVNSQNQLVILGTSSSLDYPVSGTGYDRIYNGGTLVDPYGYGAAYELRNGSDIVVTCLAANGASLVGSTFLGGSANDGLLATSSTSLSPLVRNYGDPFRGDIIVDASDNVYLASNTFSNNFPIVGGFRSGYGGNGDAVVCKLSPNLSTLLWSSFLGGSQADAAYSLQLAPGTNNLFVCGGTTSANFPFTPGVIGQQYGGNVDGFLVRISNDGSALQRATYLGTGSYDQAFFVQLDSSGDPYLLGQSLGAYPVTPGRYNNAGSHQFIHKLNADLTATGFSTVFGSGRNTIDISPTAFLVDQCDRIYASGWGGDNNSHYTPNGNTFGMPVSAGAVQPNTDGGDFYLLALSAGATGLEYATFYGSYNTLVADHVDGGTSRFDPRGAVYQSVCACGGTAWPVPPGANTYSPTAPGTVYCNNAAFRFNFEVSVAVAGANQQVCATAAPVRLGGTPLGGSWSGPGVSGSVQNGFFFTPSPALLGPQTLTYTFAGTGQCFSQASLQMTVTPPPTTTFTALPRTSFCSQAPNLPTYPLTGTPAGGTFSGPGVTGNSFSVAAAGVGTHTLTYTYTLNGCTARATQQVTVAAPPALSLGPDTLICPDYRQPIRLRANVPGGTWSGPNVTPAGVFTVPAGFTGTVQLTYTAPYFDCTLTATRRIAVPAPPVVSIVKQNVKCPEDMEAPLRVQFNVSSPGSSGTIRWDFDDGTTGTGASVEHVYTTARTYNPRVTVGYNNDQCSVTQVVPLEVLTPRLVPNVITPNGDDKNDVFEVTRSCPPRLQVFTRWGNKVYDNPDYRNDWNGGTQAAGTYYYLLTFPNGQTQKGWLEIVR
ncbi:PKD domain-containing protein [Hymenobacter gummosus]|uniref:PKD domain-containing protein n=1 Tax=Hymenobacter gummosus TaxID=1776032 RepID=A0A431U2F1_9BACT|nr:gliding motility-associated C-terminal domain-containing protein [Hymenobacter gummosus]RTQ49553.1 PKD domain-containing protein [Hymenobacter gummosus]